MNPLLEWSWNAATRFEGKPYIDISCRKQTITNDYFHLTHLVLLVFSCGLVEFFLWIGPMLAPIEYSGLLLGLVSSFHLATTEG